MDIQISFHCEMFEQRVVLEMSRCQSDLDDDEDDKKRPHVSSLSYKSINDVSELPNGVTCDGGPSNAQPWVFCTTIFEIWCWNRSWVLNFSAVYIETEK